MHYRIFIIGTVIFLENVSININQLSKDDIYDIYYFKSIDISEETAVLISKKFIVLKLISIEKSLNISIGLYIVKFNEYILNIIKENHNSIRINIGLNHSDINQSLFDYIDYGSFTEIRWFIVKNYLIYYFWLILIIFILLWIYIYHIYDLPKIDLARKYQLLDMIK